MSQHVVYYLKKILLNKGTNDIKDIQPGRA